MKAGAFVLVLLWFGASVYAGYRLTERSFAWVYEPNFGAVQGGEAPKAPALNLETLKEKIPPQLLEQAKTLSPQQMLCLQASIKPSRIQAALDGQMTAEEAAAVQTCLKK
ncbi:MAG: hypothetical protein WC866_03185 [Patescibacteria group bacterium]|jgi:hypothetical protein